MANGKPFWSSMIWQRSVRVPCTTLHGLLRTPNRPVFGFRELSMEKRMLRPSGITKLHTQWFWDMVASSSSLPGGKRPRVKASSLAEIILLSRRGSGRFSTKYEDIFEVDLVKVVWFVVYTVMLAVLFLCCLCCQYSMEAVLWLDRTELDWSWIRPHRLWTGLRLAEDWSSWSSKGDTWFGSNASVLGSCDLEGRTAQKHPPIATWNVLLVKRREKTRPRHSWYVNK